MGVFVLISVLICVFFWKEMTKKEKQAELKRINKKFEYELAEKREKIKEITAQIIL